MVGAGIINGYEDGTFRPTKAITRADLAKIVVLSMKLEENADAASGFTDIPGDAWYRGYVGALVKAGITQGTSITTFSPNDTVTREQLAVFFIRAFGLEETAKAATAQSTIADMDKVSEWARPYISLANRIGFIKGIENADGTLRFAPGEKKAERQALARLAYEFNFNRQQYAESAARIIKELTDAAHHTQSPDGSEGISPAKPEPGPAPPTAGAQVSSGASAGTGSSSPVSGSEGSQGSSSSGWAPAAPTPGPGKSQDSGITAPGALPPGEIQTAVDAIKALASAEQLTLADKQAVKAARQKVEAAKAKGAVDADITNLYLLTACEQKISQLETAQPPTVNTNIIQSAYASIGGQNIPAQIGANNTISFNLPKTLKDTDRFSGFFSVQTSGDVESISVTMLGLTKTVSFQDGTASVTVSQLMGSLDKRGDGVSVGTLRALAGGMPVTPAASIKLRNGSNKSITLVFLIHKQNIVNH